jgi:hypothetical protein
MCIRGHPFIGQCMMILRIVDEGNLAVNKSIKMTFDVTGSPNFSNALRLSFTVSRKSSMASGVSFDILG